MMSSQFRCIPEGLTYLPVHNHVANRQKAASKSRHDKNTLHLDRSSPGSHRGHQLNVAAAHATEEKQQSVCCERP